MGNDVILETKNVSKTFPGVKALSDINLAFRCGEVHALIGENGAGKSTLLNILSGLFKPDEGSRILYEGSEVVFEKTEDSSKIGIAMIHQENSLVQHLTVYENIFLGHFIKKGMFVDKPAMMKASRELLDRLKISHISITSYLKDLSSSEKQLIEIAKALSENPDIIFMDEPTAALTVKETDILMNIIRDLKQKGVAIVFISHHLEEVFEIADVCSVLRDGEYIGTFPVKDITIPQLITMMVGRTLDSNVPKRTEEEIHRRAQTRTTDVVLEAKQFCYNRKVCDAGFTLHKGEILGFAGLVGSGRTELMECVYGYNSNHTGNLWIDGQKIQIRSPKDAVRHGMGMVSEDRKLKGILQLHTVRDNVNAASWRKLRKGAFMSRKMENENAERFIGDLNVKTPSQETRISTLSGGNQQKVLLGRMLSIRPRILILDEPTHGIDVGAKAEFYSIINQLAAEGISIILISSELPELISLSHRIVVMYEGRIQGSLEFSDFDQENIMNLASGVTKQS
ncbi:MAG: sugar ABC transporter ATP-binding protein [Eubacteriales bacterium]|nr:sugar ABC transporter ATP-binding protein [Eubacteriales bacterium]